MMVRKASRIATAEDLANYNPHGLPDDDEPRLPSDKHSEQKLLACGMHSPAALAALDFIDADSFFDESHQVIFKGLRRYASQYPDHDKADDALLLDVLGNAREVAGGIDYLAIIWGTEWSPAHMGHYADIVAKFAARRQFIIACDDAARVAHDVHKPLAIQVERVRQSIAECDRPNAKSDGFHVLTSAEFAAANFDIQYLIEDMLVAGQPAIIAGPRKSLKTSVVVDMAIALASGGKFLGKFPVSKPSRVLVMSGESGSATLQETAWRICRQAGYRLDKLDRLFWSEDIPQFASIEHEQRLARTITRFQAEVLIVDPTYLAMAGADPGNLFAQGAMLQAITTACRSCGAMLILVHHTRKATLNGQFEPPELDDLAWAGFQEYARQWLLVGRREKYVPGTGEHRLWLTAGGSAGHSSRWALDVSEGVKRRGEERKWQVAVNSPDQAKADRGREIELQRRQTAIDAAQQHQRKLLEAVGKFPNGETLKALREQSGLNTKAAESAMALLLSEGRVELCKVKKNTRMETGYRPVPGRAGTCRDSPGF